MTGPVEPCEPRWHSLHVYVHGDPDYTDDFLGHQLGPAAERFVADGAASAWFFMRYWAGGPHIRLRLRNADPERVPELAAELCAWLIEHKPAGPPMTPEGFYAHRGGVAEHGWNEHGSVVEAKYEPELERYGGPGAIDIAEEFFVDSSRVALAAIRGSLAGSRRLGVAFNLFVAFTRAVCDNDAVEVAMLRRYVFSSRYNTVDAPSLDAVTTRGQAEQEFAADPGRYRASAAAVHKLVSNGERAGYLGYLTQCASAYSDKVRALDGRAELTGYGSAWTVLLSQLHMLMNRMGVTLAEEYYLSWLTSLVSAGATVGEGYHDRGMSTAARAYHEESKYFAATMDRQLPRQVSPRPEASSSEAGSSRARSGPVVLLPSPTGEVLTRPLIVDALAARRSALGSYHGPVTASGLSALLHHAAGERLVRLELPGEASLEVPSRPYPTAGALSPTRVLVLPADVPGIDPAIYQYLPTEHGLLELAPAPDPGQLVASSPYFDLTGPVSMDARSVPLWLFVTGDISAITERYGLRAYRFLMLEAGHLAQNLVLMATALGYSSLTVGAFYDDLLGQLLDLDGVTAAPFYVIPVGHV